MEISFLRAGGLLVAGTDPTGGGGVIPGYSDQRQIELLAEGGLTPLEAIKVGTLNGATYLGRADKVGSIAAGKQADLVVIDGDPSTRIGGHSKSLTRVQARHRLRPGEADRVGARERSACSEEAKRARRGAEPVRHRSWCVMVTASASNSRRRSR